MALGTARGPLLMTVTLAVSGCAGGTDTTSGMTTPAGGSGGAGGTTAVGGGASGGAGLGGSGGQGGAGGITPVSCPALGEPPSFITGTQLYTQPFLGVRVVNRFTAEPRPLGMQVVLVDPSAEGLSFRVTPPNGDDPEETTKQTTSAFLQAQGAQLALNAHFFDPWPPPDPDPGYALLEGLAVSDGNAYSAFETSAAVGLNFDPEGVATLVRAVADDPTGFATDPVVTLHNAVGARDQIVTAGENTAPDSPLEPRTAIGLTAAGLVVGLVVDGRQDGLSEGMTLSEMADLLIADFEVWDAINLDGGGSTTLVVADPLVRAVNVPSGGAERPVGSHLGVFATPCRAEDGSGAELLAYEGFDYPHRGWGTSSEPTPTGGGLAHALGGSGWASDWHDDSAGGMLNGIAVFPADVGGSGDARTAALGYSDVLGAVLLVGGAQARTSFGPSSSSRRYLDLTRVDPSLLRPEGLLGAEGSTLWLSFLAQSYSGAGDARFAYVSLGDQLRFGKVAHPTGSWGMQDVATDQTLVSQKSSADPVLFVAKIDFVPGSELLSLWLNPRLGSEPTTEPTLSAIVGDLAFGYLELAGRYSTDFDELRLGTSFAAVAPLAQ